MTAFESFPPRLKVLFQRAVSLDVLKQAVIATWLCCHLWWFLRAANALRGQLHGRLAEAIIGGKIVSVIFQRALRPSWMMALMVGSDRVYNGCADN